MLKPNLTFLGGQSQGGSYLLRIFVSCTIRMAFGRFARGKEFVVPAGQHCYIGSALAERGATSLARRLVRHATRTGRKGPHHIRELMVDQFRQVGLGCGDLLPKNGKHLRWNVDHLLDKPCAHLVGAWVLRHPARIERDIALMINADPMAYIFAPRCGAKDLPGCTNLLQINAGDAWWNALAQRLTALLPT